MDRKLLPSFNKIIAVKPSFEAFQILQRKFRTNNKVVLLNETVGVNSIERKSLDLAIVLGVLDHIPYTKKAISDIAKIKLGGYFL